MNIVGIYFLIDRIPDYRVTLADMSHNRQIVEQVSALAKAIALAIHNPGTPPSSPSDLPATRPNLSTCLKSVFGERFDQGALSPRRSADNWPSSTPTSMQPHVLEPPEKRQRKSDPTQDASTHDEILAAETLKAISSANVENCIPMQELMDAYTPAPGVSIKPACVSRADTYSVAKWFGSFLRIRLLAVLCRDSVFP